MSDLLNSANLKLRKFLLDPCPGNLLTLDEFNVLGPYQRGYASYLQSSWEQSNIPAFNPYKEGSKEFEMYKQGSHVAMMEVEETNG
jgi:hypothetical protein